jgi:hypothetical protein
MNTEREIQQLWRELKDLRASIAQRPLRVAPGGSVALYQLYIIGGNTLSDSVTDGIVYEAAGLVEVPDLYDPDIDTTFIDGIGRAELYINGVAEASNVLVAHYDGNGGPLVRALFADQVVLTTASTVTLPLDSDPTQTVTLYVPASP